MFNTSFISFDTFVFTCFRNIFTYFILCYTYTIMYIFLYFCNINKCFLININKIEMGRSKNKQKITKNAV